jgi:hypothetical protein
MCDGSLAHIHDFYISIMALDQQRKSGRGIVESREVSSPVPANLTDKNSLKSNLMQNFALHEDSLK